jgi:hypothetical protein
MSEFRTVSEFGPPTLEQFLISCECIFLNCGMFPFITISQFLVKQFMFERKFYL